MPKYLYKRDNSPHYWFELKIPQDVQVRLGMTRVRKSTHTDSLKKATRIANIWAEEIWANIEAARGPDWDFHVVKAGMKDLQGKGLTADEIDDIALQVLDDDEKKYEAWRGPLFFIFQSWALLHRSDEVFDSALYKSLFHLSSGAFVADPSSCYVGNCVGISSLQ